MDVLNEIKSIVNEVSKTASGKTRFTLTSLSNSGSLSKNDVLFVKVEKAIGGDYNFGSLETTVQNFIRSLSSLRRSGGTFKMDGDTYSTDIDVSYTDPSDVSVSVEGKNIVLTNEIEIMVTKEWDVLDDDGDYIDVESVQFDKRDAEKVLKILEKSHLKGI